MSTSCWSIHGCIKICNFFTELPVPVITVTDSGTPSAGENYTLTCNVSIITGVVDGTVVSVAWLDSSGNLVQSSSSTLVNTLYFEPLVLSHGGQYTCNSSITIPMTSTVRSNLEVRNVIVQST